MIVNSCLVVKMLSRRLKTIRLPYHHMMIYTTLYASTLVTVSVLYRDIGVNIDVNWCVQCVRPKKGFQARPEQRELIMGTASFNHLLKWRGKKVMQTRRECAHAQMMRSIKNRNLSITPGLGETPESPGNRK